MYLLIRLQWGVHACSIVSNSAALWIVACQIPLSMEFSRKDYWNGLPLPSPGALPHLRIKPMSLASPALAVRFLTIWATREAHRFQQWFMYKESSGVFSRKADLPTALQSFLIRESRMRPKMHILTNSLGNCEVDSFPYSKENWALGTSLSRDTLQSVGEGRQGPTTPNKSIQVASGWELPQSTLWFQSKSGYQISELFSQKTIWPWRIIFICRSNLPPKGLHLPCPCWRNQIIMPALSLNQQQSWAHRLF